MSALRRYFVIFCLLGLPLAAAAPSAGHAGGGTPAVDASVRETLARGEPADVLILLGNQPDLSPAQALPTKEARGRWVYETLRAAADRDQVPLVAELARSGVPYRRFWAVNAVQARLNTAQLQRVLALPHVTRVAANLPARAVEPPAPVAAAGATSLAAPAAIEWGVSRVKAPWAWSQGYTGQGIVVAGQDTGYAWDHPALINAYRGYDPATGIADHDYNWHDSIHGDIGAAIPAARTLAATTAPSRAMTTATARTPWARWRATIWRRAAPVGPPPRPTPSVWRPAPNGSGAGTWMPAMGPRRPTSNASSGSSRLTRWRARRRKAIRARRPT